MKPSGSVFDAAWRLSCEVVKVSRSDVDWMIRKHYIGKWPGVCVLILALKRHGEFLGVIVFALPPKQTNKRYGAETWELARLWIDDCVPKNAETFLIGRAVRYIKRHHKEVGCLVSYADPSVGHHGTIYKAANWKCDGRTDDERKSPRVDYGCAVTGKKYSRRSHVPDGVIPVKIPRVSKARFLMRLAV